MKILTTILLLVPTVTLSFGTAAQDTSVICGLDLRHELMERMTAQPICDYYSPQTEAGRLARINALRAINPTCYEALSADPEMVELLENIPKAITKNKIRAERSPAGKVWEESLRARYERECAALANGEPQTDITSAR